MKWLVRRLRFLLLVGALLAAAGFGVLYSGVYDVAATSQHPAFVYWILDTGLRTAVRNRAADVGTPPDLDDAALIKQGLR